MQKKDDKNKLYSWHEPDTLCISKGKVHKRYEFGSKVGIVTTNKEGFILSSLSFSENIYDGHSLSKSLSDSESNTEIKIKKCFVDKGYKGHGIKGDTKIFISGNRKKMSFSEKRQLKRRGAIEATIGHMKSDGLLAKSYLQGTKGNEINAILCGIGHNIRMILKKLMLFYVLYFICVFATQQYKK